VLESFLNRLHQHRALTLAMGLLAAILIGGFSSTLTVNDSPERWFPVSTVEAWDRFQEHYQYGDTLVMGVQFHRPVRDDDLPFLKNIRRELLAIEGIEEVTDSSLVAEQLENVPLTELIAVPEEQPAPSESSGAEALKQDRYALYRGAFFDDPSVWKDAEHAHDEGRTLLYIILLEDELDPNLDEEGQADQLNARRRHVTSEVEALIQRLDRKDVTFHTGGGIVVQHELERIAKNLVFTLVPLSVLLAMVALGIGFRSWWAVAVAVVGGGWAVAVMLGCVALLGWSLNVVTVAGPTLMAVIIISATVHIAHYYSVTSHRHDVPPSEHEHEDDEPLPQPGLRKLTQEDRKHFVHWVGVPCLGAALTTGFGFLMLAFNELQPARELGLELFIGSVLAFFGAYLAWMWFAPFPAHRGRFLSADHLEAAEVGMVKRPFLTTSVLVLLLGGFGYAATQVRVDADPFSFFRADSGPGIALEHFSDRKFGYYVLDVVCVPQDQEKTGEAARVQALKNRERIQQFEDQLRYRPELRKIISTAEWRKRLEEWDEERKAAFDQSVTSLLSITPQKPSVLWVANIALRGPEQLAEAKEQAEIAGTYYTQSAGFKKVFSNWLHDKANQDAYRVTFMVYDPGTGFRPLLDDVRRHMPTDQFDCFYTGTAASVAVLSEQLMGGITRGMIAATIAMSLVCLILFRSVRLTLIAVAPNAFPVLVVFGFMGLLNIPLNCGSAMVTTIALGVGLNDTVHFVMHYRGRRLEGADTEAALQGTFGEIGRPIILTSIVNCVGFGIFVISDFLPMAHFGLLASIAMAAALVGDLVLLPNLLRLFDQRAWLPAGADAPVRAKDLPISSLDPVRQVSE
jgi:uncharacterized protein